MGRRIAITGKHFDGLSKDDGLVLILSDNGTAYVTRNGVPIVTKTQRNDTIRLTDHSTPMSTSLARVVLTVAFKEKKPSNVYLACFTKKRGDYNNLSWLTPAEAIAVSYKRNPKNKERCRQMGKKNTGRPVGSKGKKKKSE